MTGWLQLSDEQRRQTLNQAQQVTGIGVKALEKDWWVTLVLKSLFQTDYAGYMVFKGGTSLSKGWHLINRFSEDIDIALNCAAFGLEYAEIPTRSFRDKLKRQGCAFTSTVLVEALSAQIAVLGVAQHMVTIVSKPVPADRPDTDPQTIYVKYNSLYEPNPYLPDEVKIEVSVRSLRTPAETRPIISILSDVVPNNAYEEHPFDVLTVHPRKTFLEKAFLLHEEFAKPHKTKIRHERMSRHFSDLDMIAKVVGPEALADHELYDQLIANRQAYMRLPYMDYGTLHHTRISFLPPAEVMPAYEADYNKMRQEMIYGETTEYDEILLKLKILQGRFRMKNALHRFDSVVEEAFQQTVGDESATAVVTIGKARESDQPVSEENPITEYKVTFFRHQDVYVFEEIVIV